jgi:hypothetical protein
MLLICCCGKSEVHSPKLPSQIRQKGWGLLAECQSSKWAHRRNTNLSLCVLDGSTALSFIWQVHRVFTHGTVSALHLQAQAQLGSSLTTTIFRPDSSVTSSTFPLCFGREELTLKRFHFQLQLTLIGRKRGLPKPSLIGDGLVP